MVDALDLIPGIHAPRPSGAFYAMVKLPVESSEHFARWLVETYRDQNESLVVAPGPGFYGTEGAGQNEIRLAGVLGEYRIRRAGQLLSWALEAYPGRVG